MADGEIEITLDGKLETLRSSLGAAKKVNAAGGFANVVDRIQRADLDFYILVVAAGLGKKNSEVEEAVYKTGLPALGESVARFVSILANGGKPFTPPGESNPAGEA